MSVVVSGRSGLTNAYRSVLSYCGCPEMSGASRWLEAVAWFGARLASATPVRAKPATNSMTARDRADWSLDIAASLRAGTEVCPVEAGFRSGLRTRGPPGLVEACGWIDRDGQTGRGDRKSTRLNSSHVKISYAVFCLKKK